MIDEAPFRDVPKNVTIPASWVSWISKIRFYAGSVGESGTTAERPTKNLWVGRRFFDTTLGYPVYVKTVATQVWVDGTGTVV